MFPTKITIPDHLQKKNLQRIKHRKLKQFRETGHHTKNAQRKSSNFAVVLRGKKNMICEMAFAQFSASIIVELHNVLWVTRETSQRKFAPVGKFHTRLSSKTPKKTPVITFLLPHQDNPRIIYTWNVKSSIKHFLLLKSHQTSLRGELQPPPVAKRRRRGETETRPKPDYEKDIKKVKL